MRQQKDLKPALGFLAMCIWSAGAYAAPSDPRVRIIEQPDGQIIEAVKRGDERVTWVETTEGYTIARAANGYWYYVQGFDGRQPILTRRLGHQGMSPDSPLDPHIKPELREILPNGLSEPFDESQLLTGPHDGKILIISVEFSDQNGTYHESVWADRITSSDPDAKTIADYYAAASYGKVSLSPAEETYGVDDNGVIGPVAVPLQHPNSGATATSHPDVFAEAILAADPFIDFADFDTDGNTGISPDELAIVIVAAGFEAGTTFSTPSIHGHASDTISLTPTSDTDIAGNVIYLSGQHAMVGELHEDLLDQSVSVAATLGVFVHELGHLIYGLPDLYDLDGSSDPISVFGVMGSGDKGMDPLTDSNHGETPALPSAWSQLKLGWVEPTANFATHGLTTAGRGTVPADEQYVGIAHPGTLNPQTGEIECSTDEYFLAQYRTAEGYDRGLSALYDPDTGLEHSGVVIFHVDERAANNTDGLLRLVDVEEAADPSLDQVLATPLHLWYEGNVTVFDEASEPTNSDFNLGGDSGVGITVGSAYVDAEGENAVNLTIRSECDVTGLTPVGPNPATLP